MAAHIHNSGSEVMYSGFLAMEVENNISVLIRFSKPSPRGVLSISGTVHFVNPVDLGKLRDYTPLISMKT